MAKAILGQLAAVALACALVTAYHVDPKTAAMSGKADPRPDYGVSQVLTINFDQLDSTTGSYVELFAGSKGAGGAYHVSVKTYPGGAEIATGSHDGNVDHKWVKFSLSVLHPESIVKGKKLEFRFTRSGQDSVHYYYDSMCGYNYGQMIAPYPPLITPSYGLAMRCYGRMNAVDRGYWTAVPVLPNWWNEPALRDTWKKRADSAGLGSVKFEIRWDNVQRENLRSFNFADVDSDLAIYRDVGCGAFCLLNNCAESASSRVDTNSLGQQYTCVNCAPRNLDSADRKSTRLNSSHLA